MTVAIGGLSKDELRVLDLIEEDLTNNDGPETELCRWAVTAFKYYLAAGCDPQEFVNRIPELIDVLSSRVEDVRDSCQSAADKPQAYDPEDAAEHQAEDLATVRAADGLLERLADRKFSGLYRSNPSSGGVPHGAA